MKEFRPKTAGGARITDLRHGQEHPGGLVIARCPSQLTDHARGSTSGSLTQEFGSSAITHRASAAFTLLELLVVIGIIAAVAAIALPTLNKFKPNYAASATRQLLDALARGRQLAISQRTTVYMVFVPTNFWSDPSLANPNIQQWLNAAPGHCTNLLDKQFIGYNYVSLRTVGDQPGRPTVHYLDSWRTLPEGAFIYPAKFMQDYQWFYVWTNLNPIIPPVRVYGFSHTNNIPFPSEDILTVKPPRMPNAMVPYLAFDYMGRLVSGNPNTPEIIPLAKGNVNFSHGPDRKPIRALPSCVEQPPGNATNATSFTLVYVDRLTGRARVVQPEAR